MRSETNSLVKKKQLATTCNELLTMFIQDDLESFVDKLGSHVFVGKVRHPGFFQRGPSRSVNLLSGRDASGTELNTTDLQSLNNPLLFDSLCSFEVEMSKKILSKF